MISKKSRILSIIFGGGVALSILLISLFSIIGFKDKKEVKTNYGNFHYANASEETGADKVSSFYKGGSIYLGPNNNYTMKGGVISGYNKNYGGAVYVSSGATFTMQGGVIEGNTATYGGAVYVEAGGTFIMTGGTIRNNSAKTAPAVYVEDGGIFTMGAGCIIEYNYFVSVDYKISEDTIKIGDISEGNELNMHYIEYGLYPQTYVGNTMNETLESWYQAESPISVKTYITRQHPNYSNTGYWEEYKYTDNNLYVRGFCNRWGTSYFKNGEVNAEPGEVIWFKVEPLKWAIINYDDVISKSAEHIMLLSAEVLTGYIQYSTDPTSEQSSIWAYSYLRDWLNTKFFNPTFSPQEKCNIKLSTIKNTVIGDVSSADSDGKGITTNDYVYCLSFYEKLFYFPKSRGVASPTDFALANGVSCHQHEICVTSFKPNGGNSYWWSRSSGSSKEYASLVSIDGGIGSGSSTYTSFVNDSYCGVRPLINLII